VKLSAKKKKRKKPDTKDRVYAVLVAAIIIGIAIVSSRAVMGRYSTDTETAGIEETHSPPPAMPIVPVTSAATTQTIPAVPSPAKTAPPTISQPESRSVSWTLPAAAPGVIERPLVKGTLAIVIDDVGNNLRDLEPFLRLNIPMTIAVLPGLPYSAEAARRIRAAGKEVFLHQPMEAIGGGAPGPGAITTGMERDEIRTIISRNLEEIGSVAGINNHEGSRITMDEEAMETVLAFCRERGILFLDSRTTAETAAPKAARRLGMIIGERDVFLDNVQERASMLGYINTGLVKAEQNGSAIMIGHVWSPELASLLSEMTPQLGKQGYTFSPVSQIINRPRP
jgi:polysaccharide deacetylase 2 family uncharacterized protein YibQ